MSEFLDFTRDNHYLRRQLARIRDKRQVADDQASAASHESHFVFAERVRTYQWMIDEITKELRRRTALEGGDE